MVDQVFEADGEKAGLRRSTKELAIRLLAEGLEQGEDRRGWTIDVRNKRDQVMMVLTLAEAAEGSGLVNQH